jgi:hypothetical protein
MPLHPTHSLREPLRACAAPVFTRIGASTFTSGGAVMAILARRPLFSS